MDKRPTRREFINKAAVAGVGATLAWSGVARGATPRAKPASLGGPKAHPGGFPDWPVFDEKEERALIETLRTGHWFRGTGKAVVHFEEAFKNLMGAGHCVATSCGTTALLASLGAIELGPGDEVLIPPYTFVATFNCVTAHHALPVFVDTDPESFQMNAEQIESAITKETRAILPVHIGGSPANLDKIMEVSSRRQLPVIEDACQAHLAEWRGRKVGTWGLAGCFSFQASKNLTSGEGGAVLTNDGEFAEACYNFHYQGRAKKLSGANWSGFGARGLNLRLSEFQGALLVAQMSRLAEQSARRSDNAACLTKLLSEIPGIRPAKLHEGTTRSAYHLYMFRYDQRQFAGLPRDKFLSALSAEGVPASSGYAPLNRSEYVRGLARSKAFLKIYGERRMKQWLDQTEACPQNDRVCAEAVWFTQNLLLGTREDMEQIAEAIAKIQRYASELEGGPSDTK